MLFNLAVCERLLTFPRKISEKRETNKQTKKNQEQRVYVGEVTAGDVDTAGLLPLVYHPLIHFSNCDEPGLRGSKHCLQEACGLVRKKDMLPSNDHELMKRNYRRAAPTAPVWEKRRFLRPAQGWPARRRRWCPGGILCPASLYPQESSQYPAFSLPQLPSLVVPGFYLPHNSVSLPIPRQMLSKIKLKPRVRATGSLVWRNAASQEGQRAGEVERPEVWAPTHFMPHLLGCHSNPQGFLNICVYHEHMQAVSISLARALRY